MSAAATSPALTLPQLAQLAGGDLVVRAPGAPAAREALLRSGVDGVSIDTRTLTPGALFVPLPGSRADGHAFLAQAFARGAGAALCDRAHWRAIEGREPGPLVVVEDVTASLAALASRWRALWPGLLVGLTGSSGKTTTKELTAATLATAMPTLKTEGNLNNQWGVPLTLLRLRPEHRAAVVEMGTSRPGEIAFLAAMATPTAAIITNAGRAHLEALGSVAAVAREKAALGFALPPGAPLFAGADSPELLQALSGVRARVITYGFAEHAQVRPRALEDLGPRGTRFEVDGFPPVTLRLIGRHQVSNALAAMALARELDLDRAAVVRALEQVAPTRGRMEVAAAGGATLLLDFYNANPDSTRAALDTLARWPARRRIAVLGEMKELGEASADLHRQTGAAVRDAELWAVGDSADVAALAQGARGAGAPVRAFPDVAAARAALAAELAPGLAVLVKASRGAALERVVEGLVPEDGAHGGAH
ncbi:MAG TPA: UDP-N-acetylmuramoyl-tripeptide--D-alanyl-D-alanine ligase [Candidatus Eisenbacteria bacterium]|nr:UDP-N-acetylmuramoyl-tripeptide--D-alanyl-D-alanine ligase [Candidatus Eisenbacteria bacterium]